MIDPVFPLSTYFFGCRSSSPDHHLVGPGGLHVGARSQDWNWHGRMESLDGQLAPQPGPEDEHVAWAWRLTGFTPQPYSALSWWDRTVDKRPGSNVIIFAPGHTVTAEDILNLARRDYRHLPWVLRPIEITPGWRERTWAPRAAR